MRSPSTTVCILPKICKVFLMFSKLENIKFPTIGIPNSRIVLRTKSFFGFHNWDIYRKFYVFNTFLTSSQDWELWSFLWWQGVVGTSCSQSYDSYLTWKAGSPEGWKQRVSGQQLQLMHCAYQLLHRLWYLSSPTRMHRMHISDWKPMCLAMQQG